MIKLSVCMIVKDEEKVLERALGCVKKFADEIVIVDTGSKDRTKQVAFKYTSKVYDFVWCDDFSKARNYSFSLASGDYLMWLDADDFIADSEIEKIKQLKKELSYSGSADCVMLKYVLSKGPHPFYYYRERILRRVVGFVWSEPVHEVITPHGKIEYRDIEILHKKESLSPRERNLKIYRKLLREGTPLSSRARYYYARELQQNGYISSAIKEYRRALRLNLWNESKIDACVQLADCYLLRGENAKAERVLLKSFSFGGPRAQNCCSLGQIYLNKKDYARAVEWFLVATRLFQNKLGWNQPDYYTFIPYVGLSAGYYYMGDIKSARIYHELAKAMYPEAPAVLFNEQFLT